jgi:hypothetical protein
MDFLLIQRIFNCFFPNSEDFRRIFSQNQRILDGFSPKFREFLMDFLLNLENFRWIFSQIQRILDGFSPKFRGF